MTPISRHFILKCMEMFLKIPNEYMQKLFRQEVEELKKRRKLIEQNAPRVVAGRSITNNSVSDHIATKLPNGPTACAVDLIGKEYSKTPNVNSPLALTINMDKKAVSLNKAQNEEIRLGLKGQGSVMSEVPLGSIDASDNVP
jgi:hypothetical protein